MSIEELTKIFDFIIEQPSISLDNNPFFPRDVLIHIRAICKEKCPNDFNLTPQMESFLITTFLKSESDFTADTPYVILKNSRCQIQAIKKNINNIDYITEFSDTIKSLILKELERKVYVLKKESPRFLKRNYFLALKSLKLDINTANFIDWNNLEKDELDNLFAYLIENKYKLSKDSHPFLLNNINVCISSISIDASTSKYVPTRYFTNFTLFKASLLNGYAFTEQFLLSRPISYLSDPEVLEFYYQKFLIPKHWDQLSQNKFKEHIQSFIKTPPRIDTFTDIFKYIANEEWKEHRRESIQSLANIYAKICSELRANPSYEEAIENIDFLIDMERELGKKYSSLFIAMKKYHQVIHSDDPNKITELQIPRNRISELSSTYIASSKESFLRSNIESLSEILKPYFCKLKESNSFIKKRLVEGRQKELFKQLYMDNDPSTIDFINDLIIKYQDSFVDSDLRLLLENFIKINNSGLFSVYDIPEKYEEYEIYEKVIKLVVRLNCGYITVDGPEVAPYQEYISYDSTSNTYLVTDIELSNEELAECAEYQERDRKYHEVKKELMMKIKTIPYDNVVSSELREKLVYEVPFTDDYFEFGDQEVTSKFTIESLIDSNVFSTDDLNRYILIKEEVYQVFKKFHLNLGLAWLLLILPYSKRNMRKIFEENEITVSDINKRIKLIPDLLSLSKQANIPLETFSDFMDLQFIFECVNNQELTILGLDLVKILIEDQEYVYESESSIIDNATNLVCAMTRKHKSTVPYISGETEFYKYQMYDIDDKTALLSGHYTDSCLRICGNENDFLHYALLDKNGILIKITDKEGNFIARVAGFRHGNVVFLNQLRTIYDEGGNIYEGRSNSEREDIIEALKQLSNSIVEISQNNEEETNKIDFVLITQSYALDDYPSNVPEGIRDSIDTYPMDRESEDWTYFKENTDFLEEAGSYDSFTVDITDYPLICLATSKDIENIKYEQFVFQDVPAVYTRKRNKIISGSINDPEIFRKVSELKAKNTYLENLALELPVIPANSTIFLGDNWYLAWHNNEIYSALCLRTDPYAKKEIKATMAILKEKSQNIQNELEEAQSSQERETCESLPKVPAASSIQTLVKQL